MKLRFHHQGGIALIAGAIMMTITMVLHPSGGDIHQIKAVRILGMATHSLAIFSVPVTMFGLLVLHEYLQKPSTSLFALTLQLFSFMAIIIAAALNGLALPMFIEQISDHANEANAQIDLVLAYGWSLNQAFDLIFIVGTTLALGLWSYAFIKAIKKLQLFGYAGMVLAIGLLVGVFAGFSFTTLHGLRIFVGLWVIWILFIGIRMVIAHK